MSGGDFDLMRMQVEALFVHDANGHLLRINEPDPTNPAPRFFLGRTTSGNLWRTRADLLPELAAALDALAADEPVVSNLREPPRYEDDYIQLLERYNPISNNNSGPAFTLPDLVPAPTTVTLTQDNEHLAEAHFSWLLGALDDYAPVTVIVEDGAAVAACFCSRITASVAEAGVYTEEAYRGRGYAAEVVRGWAAAVRASGRQPLYSTSWSNIASQQVVRKLGAVMYGVDYSLT